MKRKLKSLMILSLLIIPGVLILVPVGSYASSPSVTYYVPVTLTNTQTTATPANFQQMLKVDWSDYSPYLNSNVSDVRFYNSTSFSSSTDPDAGTMVLERLTHTVDEVAVVVLFVSIHPESSVDDEKEVEL